MIVQGMDNEDATIAKHGHSNLGPSGPGYECLWESMAGGMLLPFYVLLMYTSITGSYIYVDVALHSKAQIDTHARANSVKDVRS